MLWEEQGGDCANRKRLGFGGRGGLRSDAGLPGQPRARPLLAPREVKLRRIVALGGSRLAETRATLSIDREILRLSGKKRPRVLYIPTASADDPEYQELFLKRYRDLLGCKVELLLLFRARPSAAERERLVGSADIIYVGGGNTFRMMRLWKRLGVDRLLRKAWEDGKVMCGGSAGSICWFREGNSDSRKKHPKDTTLIRVSGLGFLPALHCPHYDSEKHRRASLKEMMKKVPGVAIAIEDRCALEVLGGGWRVLAAAEGRRAFRCYWKRGRYHEEELPRRRELAPLAALFDKGSPLGA